MKNFVQNGKVINYTVPADTTIASGDVVKIGSLCGVAQTGGTTGDTITVCLYGVYTLPKGSGAITQGAAVYWDATNSVVTTTASGNTALGFCWDAAASGDTEVNVQLARF